MVIECPKCHSRYEVGDRPAGTRVRCRCLNVFAIPRAQTAGVLKCPQCGAAVSPEAATCPYCQAVLATVACPRCFGRVFAGESHCSHCGAEVVQASAALSFTATELLCPRCSPEALNPLYAHAVEGFLLDECRVCAGVWMEAAAFNRLVQQREQAAKVLAAPGVALGPSAPAASLTFSEAQRQVRYLKCPACDQMMSRSNFGHRSGVIVESCRVHGIWFDKDELGKVIQFVLAGGLEAAQRAELEEKERQLAAQESRLATEELTSRVERSPTSVLGSLARVLMTNLDRYRF